MNKLKLSILLASFFFQSVALSDESQDEFDLPRLVAIQDRSYNFAHGFTFEGGYLPVDAFNKSITMGAAYTYYFTDDIAWEILNGHYAFNQPTDLKKDLLDQFAADVEAVGFGGVLDYPTYYLTSNLIYTPVYNKSLFFNKSLIHGETSFVLGGGLVNFETTGIKPLVSVGVIFRYFLSQTTSAVVDAREHVYFDGATGANGILAINLGISFQLGSIQRQSSHKIGEYEKIQQVSALVD